MTHSLAMHGVHLAEVLDQVSFAGLPGSTHSLLNPNPKPKP